MSIGGIRKKSPFSGMSTAVRPSTTHVKSKQGSRGPRSKATLLKLKQNAKARRGIIAAQVMEAYTKGWANLPEKERGSRTGIATALIRRGFVEKGVSHQLLVKILEFLARRKKISLPKKRHSRRTQG